MVFIEIILAASMLVFAYVVFRIYEEQYRIDKRNKPYEEIRAAYRFYKFKSEVEKRNFNYEEMMAEYYKFFRKNRRGSIKDIDAEIEGELEEEVNKLAKK